ncbi:MAG: GNAT family N-acetyltransferase [Bacteroidota bacterium]
MTLRPLRRDETDAAHALWQRSAPHDAVSLDLFHEKVWGEPAGVVLAAETDSRLVGLGVGVLWTVPAAVRGSLRLLAVAPEARRRGIGAALVDALADALRQRGATALRVAEAAPNYLTPGVDVRYAAAPEFLEALGFERLGESVNLGVDLASSDWHTGPEETSLAEAGVEIRRGHRADRDALGRLLDANWPGWRPEVGIALRREPISLHVAVREGSVLGFSCHSTNNAELGWFGPMGTSPEARGLGIGAILLRRCLRDLRQQGHERATIAWAAALPFYERSCGATVARRFWRYERPL